MRRVGFRGMAVAGVLALTLGGLAAMAGAQQPQPPAAGPQQNQLLTPEDRAQIGQVFWHRMQQRLGLSDQQAADIRATLQQRRDASRADVQALRAARKQLRTLIEQGNDPTAVQAAATQVKSLQDKLFDARLQTQLEIRSKLTPQQWQQWTQLRRGMGMRHRGGMMHRGMARPGMGL